MNFFRSLGRTWKSLNPPEPAKVESPLKFGILGAANIAPIALINPAKSHPEVVLQAVAARDKKRAEAYAKKHDIREVKGSYQEILDDPEIDCVFIPLPNGLHYEWAVRAIRAGKHVLLEKPSVSNATEAEKLFNLPELSKPGGPVILEAFHYRFHPSWNLFQTLISHKDVVEVDANFASPQGIIAPDDIRFKFDLAGGAIMDIGAYSISLLRLAFGEGAEECLSCDVQPMPEPYDTRCDQSFVIKYRFPNGGVGTATGGLRGKYMVGWPRCTVKHKEEPVKDEKLPDSQEKVKTREVIIWMIPAQSVYHRIDVKEHYVIRSKSDGKIIKQWTETKYHKAYTFEEAGETRWTSEPFWTTYRHQLEQFVNRVRGRDTSHWVSQDDSIAQMKMMDMAYEKTSLPARPTSSFE